MSAASRNQLPFPIDFETQMSPKTVRLRPGMPFAFPSESAFTFAGILNPARRSRSRQLQALTTLVRTDKAVHNDLTVNRLRNTYRSVRPTTWSRFSDALN